MTGSPGRDAQGGESGRLTGTVRLTLAIYGLDSAGEDAALAIEQALGHQSGVVQARVNLATEMAYVRYDPARASVEKIMEAVAQAGFGAGEPSAR